MKKPKVENQSKPPEPKQANRNRKHYNQTIFRDWCKACGICTAFCPKKVLEPREGGRPLIVRPEDCTGCRFCELHCPDFAISITESGAEREETIGDS